MKYVILFKNGVKETFNYCKIYKYDLKTDTLVFFEKDYGGITIKAEEVVYIEECKDGA